MKRFGLLLALLVACDEEKPDTAEVAQAKTECTQLLKHIVTISPQGAGKSADAIVAALPVEDIQACVATDPEVRKCMAKANDVPAVKACPGQIACANKTIAARKRARQPNSTELDKKFDDLRAKCLVDEHAADDLEAE